MIVVMITTFEDNNQQHLIPHGILERERKRHKEMLLLMTSRDKK